jgi:4-amino-4-deoxy-L-arabinose transferase-like glycosyltransferase
MTSTSPQSEHRSPTLPEKRPPSSGLPKEDYRRVFFILFGVGVLLMLILPPPSSTIILVALVAGSLTMAATDRDLVRSLLSSSITLPVVRIRARLLYALEIGLIALVMLSVTHPLQNWSPDVRVKGPEFTYVINSGVVAANVYHQTGAIPLWNPFLRDGEPLLESPFSFVLNPLMTLPIFWFGALNGTKAAVLLHVVLMGVGGWALGYVLKLRSPGRLLLGLMMGGSGSMAGAIGYGFYQMSLSQAYMPWVFAGLLGTLRTRQRVYVGILAIAATLMTFAGTFWYVLPTAIAAAILVLFHLIGRENGRLYIDVSMVRRLLWASVLVVGLGAVRLIPQAVNHDMINHPREALDKGIIPFETLAQLYFIPTVPPPFDNIAMHYHYIIAPLVALALWVGRAALVRNQRSWRPRIVIPGLLCILIFTVWAQEGTPILIWLYRTFPTLSEWRFVGRMMAAATPWFAVIAAIWLDDILETLHGTLKERITVEGRRWRLPLNLGTVPAALGMILALLVGGYAGLDAARNWERMTGLEPASVYEEPLVYWLRSQHPHELMPVWTSSFFVYLPFYNTLTRAAFGNPDYSPDPLPSTVGHTNAMDFPPPYAVGAEGRMVDWLTQIGFQMYPGSESVYGGGLIWYNPTAPTYAFAVHINDIANRLTPLTRNEAMPLTTYTHNIDRITVRLGDYTPGFVVVLQEVAFPGWQVTIDGQPATLESVGGFIGVRLPDKPFGSPETIVEFAYRPTLLYISGAITAVFALVIAAYLLRIDRWLPKRPTPSPGEQVSDATEIPSSSNAGDSTVETALSEQLPGQMKIAGGSAVLASTWGTRFYLPDPLAVMSSAPRTSAVVLAGGAVLLALLSAYYWQFPNGEDWWGLMPTAAVFFGLAALALLYAMRLVRYVPAGLTPASSALHADARRWWPLPFGLGVVMLAAVAEYNVQQLPLEYPAVHYNLQFALLALATSLVVWGLAGAPALPRLRLNWCPLLPIAAITALGLALRLWNLDWFIRALVDELHVSDGVLALWWDEHTRILTGMSGLAPFPRLYVIWDAWLIDLFGPSLAALRLASVVLGTLMIPTVYALAQTLFDRKTALIAAFFLAVLPVHLNYSRLAFPQLGDPLFGMLGFLFAARGLKFNRRFDWALAGAMLGLSQYFSEAGRLLYPPLMLVWLLYLIIVTPGHLRPQWRGILIGGLAMLLLSATLYYVTLNTNATLTARLNDAGIGSGYFTELFQDGLTLDELGELTRRVLRPIVFYLSLPPWSVEPQFAPGMTAAVLMLGIAAFVPRWRSAGVLIPGWMLATSLGNVLMQDSTYQARYVVVFPAVAVALAVGLRQTFPILWPSAFPHGRRVAGLAVTGIIGVGMLYYFFVPWTTSINSVIRSTQEFRDGVDAVLRAMELPPNTDNYIIDTPAQDIGIPHRFLIFLSRGTRGAAGGEPGNYTDATLLSLNRRRGHAFFVEPTDRALIDRLLRLFPDIQPPVYSTYPLLPANEEYLLFYLPPLS